MKPVVTFIIPIINPFYIKDCLVSLYKYTSIEFRVIVIDQTTDDTAYDSCRGLTHFWIKSYRNLGFSKAMNTGIRLTDTKYVCLANDDIVFMDSRWWQGILDTFKTDPRIIAVNPMSPKEGSWGYGHTAENHMTWQPKQGFAVTDETKDGVVPVFDNKPFLYKENFTKEDYDNLLDHHPTWSKNSMCDAIAMWCTIIRTEDLTGQRARLGLLDEKYYPGGGEDYDMNARAYTCQWPVEHDGCDEEYHYRMVGTTKSWVWHHWSKSRLLKPDDAMFASRSRWNAGEEFWTPNLEVWGHAESIPVKRTPKITIDEL